MPEPYLFPPTSRKEMEARGWDNVDIILISGDAYVDHPSFGTAVICRVLESAGYRVAVVPQPNWRDDLRDFRKLGAPRLFFGVSAGAMDSMVNHYTAAKRLRSTDAYTPNGVSGMRPDYAVTVYTKILKELWPQVPVVVGGVEASLRRLTHFDYWKESLLPSVLVESGADFLIYGMGERPVLQIAEHIKKYKIKGGLWQIPPTERANLPEGYYNMSNALQIAWYDPYCNSAAIKERWGDCTAQEAPLLLHSYEECCRQKRAFAENFNQIELNANLLEQKIIVEPVSKGAVIVNPSYPPATESQMDEIYALPFTKLPHPRYKGKHLPAYEMIKFSINTHRGCFGGCSFCTIAAHQGKRIQSRSFDSIVKEAEGLRNLPGFAGNISDLGGPTANMYAMQGFKSNLCAKCKRKSCLFPSRCSNLNYSHGPLLALYRRIKGIEGIRHAYIGSGIRYDLFLDQNGFLPEGCCREFFNELVTNHTSGRLKVAPEHTEERVLKLMHKPSFKLFERLKYEFDKLVRERKLKYQLVPYFISSHPGCREEDMERLMKHKALDGVYMEQVQDFTPTPMTLSSTMYYCGMEVKEWKPIYVERKIAQKRAQKAIFFKKNTDLG